MRMAMNHHQAMQATTTRMPVRLAMAVALLAAACGDKYYVGGPASEDESDGLAEDGALADAGQDAVSADIADAAPDLGGDAASDVLFNGDMLGDSDAAPACPGGQGCACSAAAPCTAGACLATPDGAKCAAACSAAVACPADATCTLAGDSNVSVCAPRWVHLCDPCSDASACQAPGDPSATCVDSGNGAFCASPCTANDCPTGFSCTAGNGGSFCMPSNGACTCSAAATTAALSTTCTSNNAAGTCSGKRTCSAAGLSACDAPNASSETCNGVDDNCNGVTDESVSCGDSDPCTDDGCGGAAGCKHTPNSGNACEDGDLCTIGDTCAGGACAPGTAKVCPGAGPCVQAKCANATGTCSYLNQPKGFTCDDGTACSDNDGCDSGFCVGTPISCNDNNPCTADACDLANGCTHTNQALSCDDNNACTVGDSCAAGLCSAGTTTDCDDGNPCTTDNCASASGCVHLANAATCTDGNACTADDACAGGTCVGGTNTCGCTSSGDCLAFEDNNACNGTLICDKSGGSGVCAVDLATVVTCADDGNPCTAPTCDPGTGKCGTTPTNEDKPCNADDSVCTPGDACKSGICTAGPLTDCNDGDPCTDDACAPSSGCTHTNNVSPCNADDNGCTIGDSCSSGVCISGQQKVCNDGNACTLDTCEPASGACQFDSAGANAATCDADGSVCTQGDACKSGSCVAGSSAPDCNDNNPCTDDACDPKSGCAHTANAVACDDNNACTSGDSCQNSSCKPGTLKNCDDNNVCTADSCTTSTGACVHGPLSIGACGQFGTCLNGICVGG
jgi:hypothetical protein